MLKENNPEVFASEPVGLKRSKAEPNPIAHMWHATSEEQDKNKILTIYLAPRSELG